MSTQQIPLTYEGIFEMFRESERQRQETERMIQETSEQMKETDRKLERMIQEGARQRKATNKKISELGSRIGAVIESMVRGGIVEKFRALEYDVTQYSREKRFECKKLRIRGEIDLFLEDGDVAILIEVKTTLETRDVRNHIERIEKYRQYVDATSGDKRRFVGAVAGAVVMGDAEQFAQENGMYVIVQSGKAVEIVNPPEGFEAKKW